MAQGTKISFSKEEMDAMIHPDFFYTKHAAMYKVMELLSETERAIREIVLSFPELGHHTNIESPKIFRGENYKLLLYTVLDYPRKFTTDSVFAFRSMFWWGKEFSFTLHLQGEAWQYYRQNIIKRIHKLSGNDFYCCVNPTPWQYHFERDNYLLLEEILNSDTEFTEFQSRNFTKLSRKIPVMEFSRVPEFACETLRLLIKIL